MAASTSKTSSAQWLHLLFGVLLAVTFFLPWVAWEGTTVNGSAMATGDFFKASSAVGGPDNPFPKLSFAFYLFWLIPVLSVVVITCVISKKKTTPISYIAGATSLALFTIFYLFSGTMLDLGIGKSVMGMLKPAAYIHVIAAIGLILTAYPSKTILPKIIWLLAGPVIAYAGFKMGEKFIMSETHASTENVKAAYTINADDLIKEFLANDTATNKKYLDKTLVVNGKASAVEILADSTSTIRFADSTGSYAIFSLEKSELPRVKNIKPGDEVSLKGVCSGSIFSDILGTTSISFKRAILNLK